MGFTIIHLERERWKGHILPIGYTTDSYYDVDVRQKPDGFFVDLSLKRFKDPSGVTHSPEEYDFPDKLYAEYYPNAFAWGVLDEDGELAAAIETCPEEWSNRLRVTELWVREDHRRQGIAHALMATAREQARFERRRAIILETQSCNVNAIGFYLHEGFTLTGFDACCYSNDDLRKKEVRLELGVIIKHDALPREKIEIRPIYEADRYSTELMTMRAFWNEHHQGCDEHYLVHKLWTSPDYLPELSRIALVDGQVVGCIMYSKARIDNDGAVCQIATFGPLCVDPAWQGRGVGGHLLAETLPLAASAGYPAVFIYGEPDYYPLHGFRTADNYGVTTPDGKNFSAFMGIELAPGAMQGIHGKFFESRTFEELPAAEVDRHTASFPVLPKLKYPTQWD